MQAFIFWFLSAVAVISGVFTVTRTNPLTAALSLVVCLVAIAGLFATLSAHFLFVIQLLVYAGAVMILVLYVIMILNLKEREMSALRLSRRRAALAVHASIPIALVLARVFSSRSGGSPGVLSGDTGSLEAMAGVIFTRYLFPFEVLSVLLLAAMVGAVVLAMRKF